MLSRAPHRLGRFCFLLGLVVAASAAAWGVTIQLLLPTGLGSALLGPIWEPASTLLPVVMIGMAAGGLEIGAAAGVRALGAAPRSLVAQLATAGMYLTGGCVGAYIDGARGSCWGVAVATVLATFVWWYQLNRGLAEYLNESPAVVSLSGQPERIPS